MSKLQRPPDGAPAAYRTIGVLTEIVAIPSRINMALIGIIVIRVGRMTVLMWIVAIAVGCITILIGHTTILIGIVAFASGTT